MDTAVLAICLSKLKKVASGVKKVEPSADGTKPVWSSMRPDWVMSCSTSATGIA